MPLQNLKIFSDMSGQDLSGQSLVGRDLFGVNFEGTDLSGCDLSRANLQNANLKDADLRGIEWRCANFKRAHFENTKIWKGHVLNKPPLIIYGHMYDIFIGDTVAFIGCEEGSDFKGTHTILQSILSNDAGIYDTENPQNAIDFWAECKDWITSLCDRQSGV